VPELARSNVLEMFPMKKKGGKRDWILQLQPWDWMRLDETAKGKYTSGQGGFQWEKQVAQISGYNLVLFKHNDTYKAQ
jgi:hypothetical protein